MGWKDDLQDASFRGVLFECTSTKDSVSKSQAAHQAPYSNKASIEDMGKDPRRISLNAVFTGENYKGELDNLRIALDETGTGELIHPIDGLCTASVLSYSVDHDAENVDTCYVAIEFMLGEDVEYQIFNPIEAIAEIDALSIVESPFDKLKAVLKKLQALDNDQFFQFVNRIRAGLQQARLILGLVKNTIEDILDPSWLHGLIDDVTKLVTFDTSISAISKWRDAFHRVDRLTGLFDDEDSPELKQTWRAVQVATTVSMVQAVVGQVRTELSEQQNQSTTALTLTPVDLAIIRQNTRQLIQTNIATERAQIELVFESVEQIQILKNFADQVHLQIQELIETRPPISTAVVPASCTLHWFAHYLYGDMTRANEILHLNPSLQNPALLRSGMELIVYAR